MTRSTVREAIRLLEHSGLLGRAGRKRLVACRPSKESVSNDISNAMLMHKVTYKDLWQVAMGLEPLAAQLACKTITDEYKEQLSNNLERTAKVFSDTEALLEAEIEFHDLVAAATFNNALLLAREPLNQLFYPAFHTVIKKLLTGERILTSHLNVFDAICANDRKTAEEWMRKHMQDFKRGILMAGLDFEAPVKTA